MARTKGKPGLASRIGWPLLAGALAAGAAGSVPAAADVFLKLDGITGDATDAKHNGEISILSYSQSFSNSATISPGTGGGAGRVTCGAMTFLKNIDRSSPSLIMLVTTGTHVRNGLITFRKVGDIPIEYYQITLTDVVVTAVDQTDQADPATIIEKVSMIADRFLFEYTTVDAAGKAAGTTRFGWDCTTTKKF
jgi:type VI secretion system secreted protein Hcp